MPLPTLVRRWVLCAVMLAAAGCRVPPMEANSTYPPPSVNARLLTSPAVRIHVGTVGEESIPETALAASIETLSRHIHPPIEVVRHPAVPAAPIDSPQMEIAAEFPVFQDSRVLTRDDLAGIEPDSAWTKVYKLSSPDRGLIGVAGLPMSPDEHGHPSWYQLKPIVEPDVILVLIVPGSANGLGHTGYATQVLEEDATQLRTGLVVLRSSAIRRRAGMFVPADRLWEWTLTHEIGHVLRVPANADHSCVVPGYGGIHCTRPECVMATGISWRTIASGLINGWPLDYCEACRSEIAAVYGPARQSPAPVPSTESTGMGAR